MANHSIIIISGVAGSGKSQLLEQIAVGHPFGFVLTATEWLDKYRGKTRGIPTWTLCCLDETTEEQLQELKHIVYDESPDRPASLRLVVAMTA